MKMLYLHGFASGPNAKKGVAFTEHFARRSPPVIVERPNLRVPSFEHLRLSAMIETATDALADRTILVGSSLGGLTASHTAARNPSRVACLVLLAPAFQIMARWRDQLGPAWDDWRTTGYRSVLDYTTGQQARVDFGFAEDALAVDTGFPDVRVPTLIFHGTRDEAVPIDHARRFAAGRANVRLVELDDGHELIASLPHILAATTEFLAPWLGPA